MADRQEHILLIDHERQWAERFVNALQVRGWHISWSNSQETAYTTTLYSVYLLNLSSEGLDPRRVCAHIRSLPKGENASIFLLNGGDSPLKSFEEALSLGADGLYFHKTQMPLLLANFPPKTMDSPRSPQVGEYMTLSSRHFGAGITLGGIDRPQLEGIAKDVSLQADSSGTSIQMTHQNRVAGMSLGYQNRQRLSQGYSSEVGLSVSDIEAALKHADAQQGMGKEPTPSLDKPTSLSSLSLTPSPIARQHALSRSHPPFSQSEFLTPMMTPHEQPQALDRESIPDLSESMTPPPSLPWGDDLSLSSRPFAVYFGHIISHRLSLQLKINKSHDKMNQGAWWEITFLEGELVRLRSSELQITLINHLIANASLTQRDAENALTLSSQISSLDPIDGLLDALIELNSHLLDELELAMESALTKSLYRLFELSEGSLSIKAYRRPEELRRLKLSPPRLLLNGIRESMGKLRLYKLFGTPKAIPLMGSSSLYMGHLTDKEAKVIEGAVGHRSIAELADDSGLGSLETLSLCYAFSTLGELTLSEESPLKIFFERAQTEDYFQLLSLDYTATEEEMIEAWRSHRLWLSEQRSDPELVTPLIDIINDAYCVLAHPPLRVRYLASLQKPLFSEMSIIPESYAPAPATRIPSDKNAEH